MRLSILDDWPDGDLEVVPHGSGGALRLYPPTPGSTARTASGSCQHNHVYVRVRGELPDRLHAVNPQTTLDMVAKPLIPTPTPDNVREDCRQTGPGLHPVQDVGKEQGGQRGGPRRPRARIAGVPVPERWIKQDDGIVSKEARNRAPVPGANGLERQGGAGRRKRSPASAKAEQQEPRTSRANEHGLAVSALERLKPPDWRRGRLGAQESTDPAK
jgi:hypothetical protein